MRCMRNGSVKLGRGISKEVVGDGEILTQEHFDRLFRQGDPNSAPDHRTGACSLYNRRRRFDFYDGLAAMLFGPVECPYCPGVHHWPQDCDNSPEKRERRSREILAESKI